jgi:hypothetical protein
MIYKKPQSTQIYSIVYYEDDMTLDIRFIRGAVYSYKNVPLEVVNKLINAESVGSYFNKNIAKVYKYEKIFD